MFFLQWFIMHIRKKINLKKYVILSIVHLAITYFFVKNIEEFLIVILVFMATIINQSMLVYAVSSMALSATGKINGTSKSAIFMFMGKTLVLAVALIFGVQIMGKRIIIPLINYIIQIFILYLSFRRKDLEQ